MNTNDEREIKIKKFLKEKNEKNKLLKEIIKQAEKKGIDGKKARIVIPALVSKVLVSGMLPEVKAVVKTIKVFEITDISEQEVQTVINILKAFGLMDKLKENYKLYSLLMKEYRTVNSS